MGIDKRIFREVGSLLAWHGMVWCGVVWCGENRRAKEMERKVEIRLLRPVVAGLN